MCEHKKLRKEFYKNPALVGSRCQECFKKVELIVSEIDMQEKSLSDFFEENNKGRNEVYTKIVKQSNQDQRDLVQEKWNENVETCSDCRIHWKKIGKPCKVCFSPAEKPQEKNVLERFREEFEVVNIGLCSIQIISKNPNRRPRIEQILSHLQKETDDKWREKMYKLLASAESCETAREVRHLIKEIILEK